MKFLQMHFAAFAYAFFALAFFAFVRRSRLGTRAQAVWTMVLLLCCSKFLVFAHFGGDAFVPELPEAVIRVWSLAYGGAIVLAAVSLPLFFWQARAKAVVLPVFAWAFAAVSLWCGVAPPAVREIDVPCRNLPAELIGYRIAVLSDLHCSSAARRGRTTAVVDALNAAQPDLICVLGDLVDGFPGQRAHDLEPVARLAARDGVFCVTGNHEYYWDYDGWMALYDAWGLTRLDNACVVPRPGLAIGGMPDGGYAGRTVVRPADVFKSATNGEFRVLLVHRPAHARDDLAATRADLQLSGHTHGGILPLFRAFVQYHNGGFVRGLYDLDGRRLFVTTGSGQWAGFPMRVLTPSEIPVLRLCAAPAASSVKHNLNCRF